MSSSLLALPWQNAGTNLFNWKGCDYLLILLLLLLLYRDALAA
jgi:hypothetical protein